MSAEHSNLHPAGLIALEKRGWYRSDKVVLALGWLTGSIGGLLFLMPLFTVGYTAESDPALLVALGSAVLFCGILCAMGFLTRQRLAVFEDRIVLPERTLRGLASVQYRDVRRIEITETGASWRCNLETRDGRSASFQLSGLDDPDAAVTRLKAVVVKLAEIRSPEE